MTTSGGTRAATAATSRRVKQHLVNLLFGKEFRRTGPEGHRQLDHSIYSYDDLKRAYRERLHILHPDKQQSNGAADAVSAAQSTARHYKKKEFQQLQDAWSQYDDMAKSMMKVAKGDGESANFTLFGVGCSFADNDAEKALRSNITDQACRGWFSAGHLAAKSDGEEAKEGEGVKNSASMFSKVVPLIDDSLFEDETAALSEKGDIRKNGTNNGARKSRRTLIPGIN